MSTELIIKVMTEDGNKIELQLIESFVIEGQKYSLLAPVDDDENAYVYKAIDLGDNKTEYEVVEDDMIFNMVLDEYEKMFN
ncbi:DUF1292 domain-containing protein [Oceanirhabdus sp. W0125-5]|uniref:DUF1292 domain-containing protein n=1 Tax=Oceanirhabdus sp. W0125-5 TaxID=2999116 RepID=UPI0022F3187C|nr:DUF1292 domain-containing protein [Oceanirhabdus sp. W0125-5]WBW95380.1 DUF1292 domain-containing protein [Oceanirhabdus sp. W0125-5]